MSVCGLSSSSIESLSISSGLLNWLLKLLASDPIQAYTHCQMDPLTGRTDGWSIKTRPGRPAEASRVVFTIDFLGPDCLDHNTHTDRSIDFALEPTWPPPTTTLLSRSLPLPLSFYSLRRKQSRTRNKLLTKARASERTGLVRVVVVVFVVVASKRALELMELELAASIGSKERAARMRRMRLDDWLALES